MKQHGGLNVMCVEVKDILRLAQAEESARLARERLPDGQRIGKGGYMIYGDPRYTTNMLPPVSPADPIVLEEVLQNPQPTLAVAAAAAARPSASRTMPVRMERASDALPHHAAAPRPFRRTSTYVKQHHLTEERFAMAPPPPPPHLATKRKPLTDPARRYEEMPAMSYEEFAASRKAASHRPQPTPPPSQHQSENPALHASDGDDDHAEDDGIGGEPGSSRAGGLLLRRETDGLPTTLRSAQVETTGGDGSGVCDDGSGKARGVEEEEVAERGAPNTVCLQATPTTPRGGHRNNTSATSAGPSSLSTQPPPALPSLPWSGTAAKETFQLRQIAAAGSAALVAGGKKLPYGMRGPNTSASVSAPGTPLMMPSQSSRWATPPLSRELQPTQRHKVRLLQCAMHDGVRTRETSYAVAKAHQRASNLRSCPAAMRQVNSASQEALNSTSRDTTALARHQRVEAKVEEEGATPPRIPGPFLRNAANPPTRRPKLR